MGKIILTLMFLISIVGNVYLIFSAYFSRSASLFDKIGISVFAISNLTLLILSFAWYFVFRIQKAKNK
jgi:predicted membrane channel-forming protein YqfA (hemolysin III family)